MNTFLRTSEVFARYGWRKSPGYERIKSPGFPRTPWLQHRNLTEVRESARGVVAAMKIYEDLALPRAVYLTDHAVRENAQWLSELGAVPDKGSPVYDQFLAAVTVVAVYRENYGVADDGSLLGTWEPAKGEDGRFEAADLHRVETRNHVHAVTGEYQTSQRAVVEDDLAIEAIHDRAYVFGKAFTPGAELEEFEHLLEPAPAPARDLPWNQRTWGSLTEAALLGRLEKAQQEIDGLAANRPRLEREAAESLETCAAERAAYDRGQGKAQLALAADRGRLENKVRMQVRVVEMRERLESLRTEADKLLDQMNEYREVPGRLRGRDGDDRLAAMDARHARLVGEATHLEAEIREAHFVTGREVEWQKTQQQFAHLEETWGNLVRVARASDKRSVDVAKMQYERRQELTSDADKRSGLAAGRASAIRRNWLCARQRRPISGSSKALVAMRCWSTPWPKPGSPS
jgi:hypothetical protein